MADTMSDLTLRPRATSASPREAAAALLPSALPRGDGPQLQVALGVAHAWSLDVRRHPVKIEILEGEVMVTFEGDPVDHVLAPGAVFRTSRRGRVAVAAFRPSRFSVAGG